MVNFGLWDSFLGKASSNSAVQPSPCISSDCAVQPSPYITRCVSACCSNVTENSPSFAKADVELRPVVDFECLLLDRTCAVGCTGQRCDDFVTFHLCFLAVVLLSDSLQYCAVNASLLCRSSVFTQCRIGLNPHVLNWIISLPLTEREKERDYSAIQKRDFFSLSLLVVFH